MGVPPGEPGVGPPGAVGPLLGGVLGGLLPGRAGASLAGVRSGVAVVLLTADTAAEATLLSVVDEVEQEVLAVEGLL